MLIIGHSPGGQLPRNIDVRVVFWISAARSPAEVYHPGPFACSFVENKKRFSKAFQVLGNLMFEKRHSVPVKRG
jgi:hypothetical protein